MRQARAMDSNRVALVEIFVDEAEEMIGRMEEALLALEGTPDYPGLVDGILRDARTIERCAVSLSLTDLAYVARGLANVLERVRGGSLDVTTPVTTRLLSEIEAMRQILAADGGS
jgi:two-component system chemotaxis sensor kinase CheA